MQIISPGSTIRTDGWSGYSRLSKQGYLHEPTSNQNVRNTDAIPLAHLIASLLKRWLF